MNSRLLRFQFIAGSRQILVETAADLHAVVKTDPAFWAVMGMPVDSILFDEDFIRYINTDGSARISPNELRAALQWMLEHLSDLSGAEKGSDILKLKAINSKAPGSDVLLADAKLILSNLGKPDAGEITLAEVSDRKNLVSDPCCNGDGVIPPSGNDEKLDHFIQDAISCSGSVPDLTGVPGINEEKLADFQTKLNAFRNWFEQEKDFQVFGEQTGNLHQLYLPLKSKLDEYFTLCEICSMNPEMQTERFAAAQKVDPMDFDAMSAFMKKSPAAVPSPALVLNTAEWLNPEWKSKIIVFADKLREMKLIAKKGIITETEWKKIDSALAPVSAWVSAAPAEQFSALDRDMVREYCDGPFFDQVRAMIAEDVRVQEQIASYDSLRKLIVYQKNMVEFLNNYISLERLFDPERPSILQPGYLIMDGRHFTLVSVVTNLAEHKKIIQRSRICVMYVELTSGTSAAQKKMTLAVAVTSGTMRNIFVGKTGIFMGRDGMEWFAKVIDMVQQPVSMSEALQMPFFRLGEILTQQADKFFSAKSKAVESGAFKELQNSAAVPAQQTKAKPVQQTPAISGSMMLMGGGVGIAAIGSAFAFIAKSLKGISVLNVLTVLIGIIIVISAPVIFVSIVKLLNRKVSDFLAAGGWAVNPKMRLSRKMGMIFTHVPMLGVPSKNIHVDMIETFSKRFMPKESHKLFFIIVILLLILGGASYFYVKTAPVKGWPMPCFLKNSCSVKLECCPGQGRGAKAKNQNIKQPNTGVK